MVKNDSLVKLHLLDSEDIYEFGILLLDDYLFIKRQNKLSFVRINTENNERNINKKKKKKKSKI